MAPFPLASAEKVKASDESTVFEIECKYDIGNCQRKADDVCHQRYDIVHQSSLVCGDCGWSIDESAGSPVWQGTLTVRCL
jgi:hypothetical protein